MNVWVLEYEISYGYGGGNYSEVTGVFQSAELAKSAISEHVSPDQWRTLREGRCYEAPGMSDKSEWKLYRVPFNNWNYPEIGETLEDDTG
jgi:hypothetical protein